MATRVSSELLKRDLSLYWGGLNGLHSIAPGYDRNRIGDSVPEFLEQFVSGRHYLYGRQIPTCLALKRAGRKLRADVKAILLEEGFPLFSVHKNVEKDSDTYDSDIESIYSDEGSKDPKSYEDPFKVISGYLYAALSDRKLPEIMVWPESRLITGKLPPHLLGKKDTKNRVRFNLVESHDERVYLIRRHTHWGHRMMTWVKDKSCEHHSFAQILNRRLTFYLKGRHDPIWDPAYKALFHNVDGEYELRSPKTRVMRLIEVLKTIDGIFIQRYMAYPEDNWDWEKYDLLVLTTLSILISDEFLDGQLPKEVVESKSRYSELKAGRKAFKLQIHTGARVLDPSLYKDWVFKIFSKTWGRALKADGHARAYLAGILSQTRGSGTPPPIVVLQSKLKFLNTVSKPPAKIERIQSKLIWEAMNAIVSELPQEAFTGLGTKARINITGAASWEQTRKEGGTAQAVLDLLNRYGPERWVPIIDLYTGKITDYKPKEAFNTVGDLVFAACLDEVARTTPEELREVHLTTVKEPGKARTVTKGRAALKIVLDTVSKICAFPLKKGIVSSRSGMGASNHAWNAFTRMMSEDYREELFSASEYSDEEFADYIQRDVVWTDIYAGSTDYQEATDFMHHSVGRIIAKVWMTKCGIPPFLQGIVLGTSFEARTVYFSGTGVLEEIGEHVDGNVRRVGLHRGVLMGDPMTKVCLHMANVITRRIAEGLFSHNLLTGVNRYLGDTFWNSVTGPRIQNLNP